MIENSDKWLTVEAKLEELRELTDANWEKGEWELAALGQRTIRTVEQSRFSAKEMIQGTIALTSDINCFQSTSADDEQGEL